MASRRRQKLHHSVDLISDLPEDLIVKILLCLPLQEAVRTSLLSKGWRYKWITIPHLLFDTSTFSSASKHGLLTMTELFAIIHLVLSQHEGPISKFIMSLPKIRPYPKIDRPLISYIFELNFCTISSYLFFSCLKLRFANLTNLELCSVRLPDGFDKIFLPNCCPLLECLKLRYCANLDRVDFYSPTLKLLDYNGSMSYISFKNTPSLEKVSIEHDSLCPLKLPISWIDTFSSLPSLEHLQIGSRFISKLDVCIARDMVASHLNCLVTLVVSLQLGLPYTTWLTRCTICLIKSSPNLQKLVIKLVPIPTSEEDGSEIQFSNFKEFWDFFLEKHQYVEVSWFIGRGSHMALIEVLLAKSPMLETLHIFYCKWGSVDKIISDLQKINQVPRASPRAKVIFVEMMH